jgi:hypothetical protein
VQAASAAREVDMDTRPDLTNAQLFVDDTWIGQSLWLTRRWHQPRKHSQPVLVAEHPWERWCPVLYGSVLHWRDRYRMWYATWTRQPRPRACYAESDDGVVWRKPALGIYPFEGSTPSNIVLESSLGPEGLIDDLTVIDDPDDAPWPLKMLYWQPGGIHAARSEDGVHWDTSPGNVLPGWGDRFNALPARLAGQYVLYGRAPVQDGGQGRRVWRTASPDLRAWSEPELVLAPDVEDAPYMQYYSLVPFAYEGLLLGGLERMYVAPDKVDTELVSSRDGRCWQRSRPRPAFLSWGPENAFDSAWVNLSASAPIRQRNLLWFYYSGRAGAHGAAYPMNFGGIGLGSLRVDGFASLAAQGKAGLLVTAPMEWPDADLAVNFDPRPDPLSHPGDQVGELHVEVRGGDGLPLAGYQFDQCPALVRNTHTEPDSSRTVRWAEGRSAQALAGQRLRLAFRLRDGHLYSFRARRATATSPPA